MWILQRARPQLANSREVCSQGSACGAGMYKTEEAENRKGGRWLLPALGEDGSSFVRLLTKSPCLQGPGCCHLAPVLSGGHFFSRFLGELKSFSPRSVFLY